MCIVSSVKLIRICIFWRVPIVIASMTMKCGVFVLVQQAAAFTVTVVTVTVVTVVVTVFFTGERVR